MLYARVEGIIEEVSQKGDFGFVYPTKMSPAEGHENLPMPDTRVFVHVSKVIEVRKFVKGLPLVFDVVDSERHQGKLEADEVLVRPRLIGNVHLPVGRDDIGFIKPDTIDYAPECDDPIISRPTADVFIHVSALRHGPRKLTDDMRIAFYAVPVPTGRYRGKLEAKDVERL